MVLPNNILDYLRIRSIPNRPNTFFKYMTAKVAKIALVNHTLRWSSPLLFNDPFDVQRNFSWGFEIEEIKEPLLKEIVNLISSEAIPDFYNIPYFIKRLRRKDYADIRNIILPELPQLIDKGMQNAKNDYERIKKQWSEFIPQFRILSFSSASDNLLMWSHYSDSHKGIVLELQSVNSLDSPWLIAQPVTYQNTPPVLVNKDEWIKYITGQKFLNCYSWQFYAPLTLAKTTDWEYEKEWRIVSFMRPGESGLYADYPFNPPEVCSVYLGCEVSDEDAKDIISLLNYDLSHVRAYRAKKIERDKKISFERVK